MLQKIRRRDLILLSGAFSLACFSLIVVVLLILRSQPAPLNSASTQGAEAASTPGPQPTHTVTFVEITGLSQYPPAEAAAKAWATDAQLVSANANWPQILNMGQMGEPVTWNYRFYSPAKERLFFALVDPDGRLRMIEHRIPVTLPPPPSPWRVGASIARPPWPSGSITAAAACCAAIPVWKYRPNCA